MFQPQVQRSGNSRPAIQKREGKCIQRLRARCIPDQSCGCVIVLQGPPPNSADGSHSTGTPPCNMKHAGSNPDVHWFSAFHRSHLSFCQSFQETIKKLQCTRHVLLGFPSTQRSLKTACTHTHTQAYFLIAVLQMVTSLASKLVLAF